MQYRVEHKGFAATLLRRFLSLLIPAVCAPLAAVPAIDVQAAEPCDGYPSMAACLAPVDIPPGLLGDCCGFRSGFAQHGITVDADATLFYMGVADGGVDREFRFAGHNDYVVNMDMGKLGVQEGLFVKLRAEHRYGEPLGGATGALLPSNVVASLPVLDSEEVYLTNVLFTQMFSEQFGVFFGKLDTFDGDLNAFAHGRGKTQFSNLGFVVNPTLLRTVPYSTLGVGFVVLGEGAQPLFQFSVLNPTDTARTSGISELYSEGVTLAAELRLPTQLFGMPGHQLVGGTWSSRDVASLGQDPRIVLPNVPIARQSDSWALYWNFDQYLVTDACNPQQGWGVFGRAGLADDQTNPLSWFLSFGVGGNSQLRGRQSDTFGVGWYYAGTSDELGPLLQAAVGPVGDGQGVEMFYNVAVTPWLHITPDLQFIVPARENVDTATVAGLRAQLIF
ncbi:carbohydrate porin [Roseimaritima sediminicola]|uniref:carbohydrate porin n=1 Tax=Roseimaritima sediminicola TaxID=2662066 RepID=UPI0012983395|nr:carbohydrate porin [Roseimaritima sediminicola]